MLEKYVNKGEERLRNMDIKSCESKKYFRKGVRSQGEKEKEEIEKRQTVSGTKDSGKRRRERRQKEFQEPMRELKRGDREDRKGFRNHRKRENEDMEKTERVSVAKESGKRRI